MTEHYSTFALDLYWIDRADPALAAHVATCESCREYLAHLAAVDLPIGRPTKKRTWWPLALVAAAVLAIALWPRTEYLGIKGTPAVQLLLQREGNVRIWAGEPVHANDGLALRVACDSASRVTVLARDRDHFIEAFSGACADGVLPFTLVVDDQPGSERIAVVLGLDVTDFVLPKESR